MPIDLQKTISNSCGTLNELRPISQIFESNLITSAIIVGIVLLFVLIFIPVKANTPPWIIFKFIFYSFGSILGILTLYENFKLCRVNNEISPDLLDRLENPLESGVDDITVRPTVGGEADDNYEEPDPQLTNAEKIFKEFKDKTQ